MRDGGPEAIGQRLFALGLAAASAVGLVLGGTTLAREPLGNDEIASLALVSRSFGSFLSDFTASQSAGLLFHVVLWPFAQLGGPSSWALRLPSLLAFAVAIVVCGLVGARLAGRSVGLSAALFLAVCPFAVFHAQDARMYTFALCFSLVALWCLLRALERPGVGRWAAYAGAVAAVGYSHEFALLGLVAHVPFVLADPRRRARRDFLVALCGAAALLVPLAIVAAANAGSDPLYYVTRPGLQAVSDVILLFAGSRPGVAVCLVVIAVGVIASRLPRLRSTLEIRPGTVWALALWLLVPFAALFLVSQARAVLLPRYLIPSAAAACLALAIALWLLRQPFAVAGCALVGAALLYGSVQGVRTLDRPDWPGVARLLAARTDGRPIVFVGGQRNAAAFLYYAPEFGVERDALPWTQAELDRLPESLAIIDRDNDVDDLRALLEEGPTWVVEQGALPAEAQEEFDRFLGACDTAEREEFRSIAVGLVSNCPGVETASE